MLFLKGEVHVPQSELGSLLITAEGLQVKGLAVPDDATRAKKTEERMSFAQETVTHASQNSVVANKENLYSSTLPNRPLKRRRTTG